MSKKKARGREPEVRRYLTGAELDRHWTAIEAALRAKKETWGLQGWAIQGRGSRLRVVAKVPYCRVKPQKPVTALRIGSKNPFLLKVGVQATFHALGGARTGLALTGSNRRQTFPLAAGSPIEVVSGGRRRCGVGAILDLDGEPHLLTCGHTFESSSGKVRLPGQSSTIAELTRNLLDQPEPLDAAICALTSRGIDLLEDSKDADTWLAGIREPSHADNDRRAVFWPTSEDEPDPIDIEISSFSVCFEPLFGPAGPQCRFIEAELPASEGDSGSALVLGDSLYGLCSGTAGSSSYFTAIADVVEALRTDFGSIQPWQPA